MKIEQSQVTKLMITGVKDLDPVAVIVENFGPGAGKITITCFGEAWSNYWGSMCEQHTLESFFCKADKHYLAGKLKTGIKDRIRDTDPATIEQSIKTKIIKYRKEGDMEKAVARDCWDSSTWLCEGIADNNIGSEASNLLYTVFGDEWWCCLPEVPNPDYEYLCRIIETVKEAFKQLKEQT